MTYVQLKKRKEEDIFSFIGVINIKKNQNPEILSVTVSQITGEVEESHNTIKFTNTKKY